ncbi:MAG: hypothetical protein OXI01_23220 [Albidovulum sp.]|nr:hypothetical protein [Albidovulum sp.]
MSDQVDQEPKRKRGRPRKPFPKIDASPEEIARAIFSAVKPPDPSLRKFNVKKSAGAGVAT